MQEIRTYLRSFLLLFFVIVEIRTQTVTLPKLNIDPAKVSVSGISSGAAMAAQYHFAHSSEVLGAGMFAGVPYMCAAGGLTAALACMSSPLTINVQKLISEVSSLENQGSIDSTSNIRESKVYIYQGSRDTTVKPAAGPKVEQLYSHYGASIKTEFSIAAEHGQPTDGYGAKCESNAASHDFISSCGYDGAFEMLNHLYGGNLRSPNTTIDLQELQMFDQSEFFNYAPSLSSMDTVGFVYVPSGCASGAQCALHIVYHGCQQYRQKIGDTFATKTGYLEAAESNNIVLLFPQVVATLANPNGCWDWWGYLNLYFPTKIGNQVLATYRMSQRLING